MYFINKITSDTTVDFAAEEMRKYLRMMMPDGRKLNFTFVKAKTSLRYATSL